MSSKIIFTIDTKAWAAKQTYFKMLKKRKKEY